LLAYEGASTGRELFIFTPEPSPCETPVARASIERGSLITSNEQSLSGYI
jgi:hypothetical protein